MKKLSIVSLLILTLAGCVTLEKWQANPAVQAAETAGAKIALASVAPEAVPFAWTVPLALNSISSAAQAIGNKATVSTMIVSTVADFTAGAKASNIGPSLAKAFTAANPQTPAETQAVIVALGKGFSSGVNEVASGQP